MSLIQLRRPWTEQQDGAAGNHDWAFVWDGADPNNSWTRASSLVNTVGLPGRGVTFTGNVSNSFSKPNGVTAAQDRVTFVAVLKWVSGVGTTNGICATNSNNAGHIFYSASGTPRYTKGAAVDINAAWSFTSGDTYSCVVSHDRVSGAYHILGRNLNTGVVSETSGTNTTTPFAGDGVYKVGGFRDVDGTRAFNGDIFLAAAGLFYTPLSRAYELLFNPWQLFAPRAIPIPLAAAAGGSLPTLSNARATSITTTTAVPVVDYAY